MKATIRDVSRQAGVSIKTVSRVLNKERYVGAETRAKVEAAVAALNFRPSSAARSLAGHRSYQIGLICDNPSPYYVFEMQAGVRDRCEADGIRLIAQPYDRRAGGLRDAVESLVDTTPVDGLILTPPASDDGEVLALLAARGIRVVRVSPGTPGTAAATFIDNRRAAATMTAHLLALGHRRIAHVAGPADYAASGQRREGFHAALEAAGIVPDPTLAFEGGYDFASGDRAGRYLLDRDDPPTAIFAASDDIAAGILAAAHRLGLRLPDACSVVGFGDDALAGYVWPPLTTIRQPTRALGWNAADLLLSPDAPVGPRELPFDLVVRGSSARLSR